MGSIELEGQVVLVIVGGPLHSSLPKTEALLPLLTYCEGPDRKSRLNWRPWQQRRPQCQTRNKAAREAREARMGKEANMRSLVRVEEARRRAKAKGKVAKVRDEAGPGGRRVESKAGNFNP